MLNFALNIHMFNATQDIEVGNITDEEKMQPSDKITEGQRPTWM